MVMRLKLFVLWAVFLLTDCAPPDRWTTPPIASANGNGTLDETLSETFTVGSILGSVVINNVPTAYEIVSQTYDGMFNVTFNSSRGDIYLINNTFLDFETDTELTVLINGSNDEGFGVATLTIRVTDENDNIPTFPESSYLVQIASTFSNDSTIFTLLATDIDSTVNNDITYSIVSGDDAPSKFSIGARTGQVKRTGVLFSTNRYTLGINATDGGSPPLVGSTSLIVCIDCNSGGKVTVSALFGLLTSVAVSILMP